MEFRVLGPVEAFDGDARVPLGGPKRRALLAMLLLNANRVVPVDRLIDAVWGQAPPATATAQVQAAVSALRKALANDALGGERIITRTPGYLVRLHPGELDLELFERDADVARQALLEGDVAQAADGLRAALDWWRGAALSDLVDSPIQSFSVGLEERRTAVLEERIEADLALGRHASLIPELTVLVAENTLRERLRGQLMIALYRAGRQADALAAYRDARAVLVHDLGLEPGPALQRLEQAILAGDPALDLRPLSPRSQIAETGTFLRPLCPYRGLDAFDVVDHGVFFGRTAEITELVERLRDPGPVTVVGPSGCGKSSLIFAGVIPELLRYVTPPTVASFRPSDARTLYTGLAAALMPAFEPGLPETDQLLGVSELAGELASHGLSGAVSRALTRSKGEEIVLVVDQVEELLVQHPEQVEWFAQHVLGPGAPAALKVLLTMRADFLDAALGRPSLAAPLRQSIYTLGAMTVEQLSEVVTGPLAGTGVVLQAGLADRILTDVGNDPGALPLLGFTMTLLWERQSDGQLTHDAYDALGRVSGSLARYAEEVWRRSNLAEHEDTARQLFTQLVYLGPGGEVTRRVASRDDLGEQRWELAQRLAISRLLVTGRDAEGRETVELAHEALIHSWSRLDRWIEADRAFRRWQEALRADLARWERAEREPALLSRGSALAEAQRWSGERAGGLSPAEIDFIERARSHDRALIRRRVLLRSMLALGTVLTLLLGGLFVYQRGVARQQSAEAASRELAVASTDWADRDPVYSAMLAIAAYRAQPTDEATSALFRPYLNSQGVTSMFSNPEPGLFEVQMSADGKVVAGATERSTVTVWTREPGGEQKRTSTPVLKDGALPIALTADGSAVWLVDAGWLSRFDVSTGRMNQVTRVGPGSPSQLAASSDGDTIAVVLDEPAGRRAFVWDVLAGRREAERPLPDGDLRKVTLGPDGSLMAQVQGRDNPGSLAENLEVWGPGDATRRVGAASTSGAVVTPDGEVAVTCSQSNPTAQRLTTLRLADGKVLGQADFRRFRRRLVPAVRRRPNRAAGGDSSATVRDGAGPAHWPDALTTAGTPAGRLERADRAGPGRLPRRPISGSLERVPCRAAAGAARQLDAPRDDVEMGVGGRRHDWRRP